MAKIMIVTTKMLMEQYSDYSNQYCKIGRLEKEGKITKIIRGLYETDPDTPGYCLAGFRRPSYLSFQYALYRHDIIPERVYEYTSATTNTGKSKTYETPFGIFSYQDVPTPVFRFGVELIKENGRSYLLAEPFKAICDQLYSLPPVTSMRELEYLVFDDQRMDFDDVIKLQSKDLSFIAPRYRCKNVTMFEKMVRRLKDE